jgi:hypothetical protein
MLKNLIKEVAVFNFYRKGELHYVTSDTCFHFVVPIDDCGDGEFSQEIKGITMMRWIRKQLEANAVGREST